MRQLLDGIWLAAKLQGVTDETIYHITERGSWEVAQARGVYVAESLAAQGFIHASTREQVVETANLFYAGQDGLVLLCIDATKLTAPLRWEPPENAGHQPGAGRFPHVYGPLNLDAVTGMVEFPCSKDGTFQLPQEMRE